MKTLQIWCTEVEQEGKELNNLIQIINKNFGYGLNKKYKIIIYVSGTQSIIDLTADLLKRNKECPTG